MNGTETHDDDLCVVYFFQNLSLFFGLLLFYFFFAFLNVERPRQSQRQTVSSDQFTRFYIQW